MNDHETIPPKCSVKKCSNEGAYYYMCPDVRCTQPAHFLCQTHYDVAARNPDPRVLEVKPMTTSDRWKRGIVVYIPHSNIAVVKCWPWEEKPEGEGWQEATAGSNIYGHVGKGAE